MHSTCPNHRCLPFLITKLTGSKPDSFFSSAVFLLLYNNSLYFAVETCRCFPSLASLSVYGVVLLAGKIINIYKYGLPSYTCVAWRYNGYGYGCVMYADDLILLSASVSGLESMLDYCYAYGLDHIITFNSKKSVCCHFGSGTVNIASMVLGNNRIEWVNSFKYLGITFNNIGSKINVDCHVLKSKFYSACNSVLSHCRRNDDLVKLHLVKSFCLPMLTLSLIHI